jgi:hypothetical protein
MGIFCSLLIPAQHWKEKKKTSRLSTGVWFFFFWQANGVVGSGGLNLFFLLVISNELIVDV